MITFRSMPVSVSKEKVLRRLGYSKERDMTDIFKVLLDDEYNESLQVINVDGVLERLQIVNKTSESLIMEIRSDVGLSENSFSIQSKSVAEWMKDCNEIYMLAVTAGDKISSRITDLSASGEVSRAMIADALGSEVVEEAAQMLSRYVEREVGRQVTKRFSPGYGDWHLEAQADIDRILDLEKIGIKVNERYIMQPEKSITAIIGVKQRSV